MNPVFVQIRKDLVPLRSLLLVGAFVAAVKLGLALATFAGVPIRIGGNLDEAILWILLWVLIVRAVHLDPLVDTEAFWRTRPLSGRELLLAKLLLWLPLLLIMVLFVQPRTAQADDTTSFRDLMFFSAGLFAFATVTARFSEMVKLVVKIVFVTALIAALISALIRVSVLVLSSGSGGTPNWLTVVVAGAVDLRGILEVVLLGGFLSVGVHQYLTQNSERSIVGLYLISIIAATNATLSASAPSP